VRALELRSHLRVLWRRKRMITLLVLLAVGAALALSLVQKPVYQGEVKVLLQPAATESLFDPTTGDDPDPVRRVQTEIEVVKSEPVRAAVRRELGSVPRAQVSPVGETDLIEVKARSGDRARAAAIARAYADAYIEFRRTQSVADLGRAQRNIEAKIADLQRQIDALEPQASTSPATSTTRDQLLSQQALFKQRLDELQVDAELKMGGAQVVTTSRVPTAKVAPTPVRTTAIAFTLAAVLAVGLAFFLESLDDSIRTKDDLERAVPALPTLGLILDVDEWKDPSRPLAVTLHDAESPPAESYRSLRTSLQFIGDQRAPRIVQLTSSGPGEGKTSTLTNLGVVLARAGQRVVMVDCDLRRARLHEFFGLRNDVGLTSVFVDEVPLSGALQRAGDLDLWLLSAGPLPPNPSELLAARRTGELLHALASEFDVVLLDCPPVLPVTDATALSVWVEATVLLASAGITRRDDLQRTVEVLLQAEAPLVGTVLNRVTPATGYGYSYAYNKQASNARPWRRRARSAHRAAATGRRGNGAGRDAAPSGTATRSGPVGNGSGAVANGPASGVMNGDPERSRPRP
jgi:succinoglycan biosynthesis transport protein ExoP